MLKKLRKCKGFTLIEMLLVLLIIGILFSVLTTRMEFVTDRARQTGLKADFRSYQMAFEQYFREKAGYSADTEFMSDVNTYLDSKLQIEKVIDSKCYFKAKDYWGKEYLAHQGNLNTSGTNDGYIVLQSAGQDGIYSKIDVDKETKEISLSVSYDDYILYVTWVNGDIDTNTLGFEYNIE